MTLDPSKNHYRRNEELNKFEWNILSGVNNLKNIKLLWLPPESPLVSALYSLFLDYVFDNCKL